MQNYNPEIYQFFKQQYYYSDNDLIGAVFVPIVMLIISTGIVVITKSTIGYIHIMSLSGVVSTIILMTAIPTTWAAHQHNARKLSWELLHAMRDVNKYKIHHGEINNLINSTWWSMPKWERLLVLISFYQRSHHDKCKKYQWLLYFYVSVVYYFIVVFGISGNTHALISAISYLFVTIIGNMALNRNFIVKAVNSKLNNAAVYSLKNDPNKFTSVFEL